MRSRLHSSSPSSIWLHGLAITGLAGMIVWLGSQLLFAGSVTNPGGSPVVKLAVYEGVLSITPGRGATETLEFGNSGTGIGGALGQEISSTGNIIFRPGSLAEAAAVRFDGTRGTTDIYVPGRLCINGACVPAWPTGGGVSYWQQVSSQVTPIVTGGQATGVRVIEPISNVAWERKAAVAVYGTSSSAPSLYVSNTGGPAVSVNGNIVWRGDVNVTTTDNVNAVTVDGSPVWHPGNDGIGSTLDADGLDGFALHFSFRTPSDQPAGGTCTGFNCGTCSGGTRCLCTTGVLGTPSTNYCIRLQ